MTGAIIAVTSLVLVLGAAAYFIPGGPTEWVKVSPSRIFISCVTLLLNELQGHCVE